MRLITLYTAFFLLITNVVAAKNRPNSIILDERSVEATQFQMVNATGNGFILAKACSECPELHLHITPDTQAFHNSKPASLQALPGIVNFTVTVVYDPKSFAAKRIYW